MWLCANGKKNSNGLLENLEFVQNFFTQTTNLYCSTTPNKNINLVFRISIFVLCLIKNFVSKHQLWIT